MSSRNNTNENRLRLSGPDGAIHALTCLQSSDSSFDEKLNAIGQVEEVLYENIDRWREVSAGERSAVIGSLHAGLIGCSSKGTNPGSQRDLEERRAISLRSASVLSCLGADGYDAIVVAARRGKGLAAVNAILALGGRTDENTFRMFASAIQQGHGELREAGLSSLYDSLVRCRQSKLSDEDSPQSQAVQAALQCALTGTREERRRAVPIIREFISEREERMMAHSLETATDAKTATSALRVVIERLRFLEPDRCASDRSIRLRQALEEAQSRRGMNPDYYDSFYQLLSGHSHLLNDLFVRGTAIRTLERSLFERIWDARSYTALESADARIANAVRVLAASELTPREEKLLRKLLKSSLDTACMEARRVLGDEEERQYEIPGAVGNV